MLWAIHKFSILNNIFDWLFIFVPSLEHKSGVYCINMSVLEYSMHVHYGIPSCHSHMLRNWWVANYIPCYTTNYTCTTQNFFLDNNFLRINSVGWIFIFNFYNFYVSVRAYLYSLLYMLWPFLCWLFGDTMSIKTAEHWLRVMFYSFFKSEIQ
jgi:hypothetical protein